MRRLITRLLDRLRYGKIYQPTEWQRAPEPVSVIRQLSPVRLPPVIHCKKNGDWSRYYLNKHPELRITRKVTEEETAKYKVLPWFLK